MRTCPRCAVSIDYMSDRIMKCCVFLASRVFVIKCTQSNLSDNYYFSYWLMVLCTEYYILSLLFIEDGLFRQSINQKINCKYVAVNL